MTEETVSQPSSGFRKPTVGPRWDDEEGLDFGEDAFCDFQMQEPQDEEGPHMMTAL